MKTYRGMRGGALNGVALVDNKPLLLRAHLFDAEPREFDWGLGSRATCRQHLAIAILADCLGDDAAQVAYLAFQFQVINDLPRTRWEISEKDVRSWHFQWKTHAGPSGTVLPSDDPTGGESTSQTMLPDNLQRGNSAMNRNFITTHDRKYPRRLRRALLVISGVSIAFLLCKQYAVGGLFALLAAPLFLWLIMYCPYCRRHFALRYRREGDLAGWRCIHCDRLAHRIIE